MKNIIIVLIAILLIALIGFSALNKSEDEKKAEKADTPESYQKIVVDSVTALLQDGVAEIFEMDCSISGCHQGMYPKKKLDLEPDQMIVALVNVPSREIDTLKLVDWENPQKSYLLMKIRGDEGMIEEQMPIEAPPLSDEKIKVVEDWIIRLAKANEVSQSLEKVKE